MYPRQTAWFIKQYMYEEAVRRPFGYLFVDLKPTTQESYRLRTNVLPSEERFHKGEVEDNVSMELLQYLKQQHLMAPPVIPKMQRLQNNMDGILSGRDLGVDEKKKTRQYIQLQNRFLTNTSSIPNLKQQRGSSPESRHNFPPIFLRGNYQQYHLRVKNQRQHQPLQLKPSGCSSNHNGTLLPLSHLLTW